MLKSKHVSKAFAVAALASVAQSSFALPDRRVQLGLGEAATKEVAKDPVLSTSLLVRDDLRPIIYVGPGHKTFSSEMQYLSLPPRCEALQDTLDAFYATPKDGDIAKAIATNRASPFVERLFGTGSERNAILKRIAEMQRQAVEYIAQHKEVFEAYNKAKDDLEAALEERRLIQSEIQKAQDLLDESIRAVSIATTAEERATALERVQLAKEVMRDRVPGLTSKRDAADSRVAEMRTTHAQAFRAWAPFKAPLDELNRIQTAAMETTRLLDEARSSRFDDQKKVLSAHLSMPVGRVSVAYAAFSAEVSRFNQILAQQALPLTSQALQIFDVRMRKGIEILSTPIESGSETKPEALVVDKVDVGAVGTNTAVVSTPVHTGGGEALKTKVRTIGSDAVGDYAAAVSFGAFCGAQPKSVELVLDGKREVSVETLEASKTPPRSGSIFRQEMGLEYSFFSRAEPVEIECRLDLSNFVNYSRNSGSKRFLWRKRSWDDVRRARDQDSGVECAITNNPTDLDSEQGKNRVGALYDRFMAEIQAEVIMNFAESWKVVVDVPTLPAEALKAPDAPSYTALCGHISYCRIADIVWKTGDALFGGASGQTSTVDNFSGSVRRSYRELGYLRDRAETKLVLDVRVP